MALQNLERERADFSLKEVQKVIKTIDEGGLGGDAKYYRGYVEKMPALVLNGGLLATLAFVKAKGSSKPDNNNDSTKKKAYRLIYDGLNGWLRNKIQLLQSPQQDLVHALISADSHTARLLTKETLNLLGWLKRIAKAEIEQSADDE